MAIVARNFTYFDRAWTKGDEVDNDDPVVTLLPHMFEPSKKKAAKPATPDKKERP